MKTCFVVLLVVLVCASVYAQKPYTLSTIAIAPDKERYNTTEKTIQYPIFHFNDERLERKINRTIRETILDDEREHDSMSLQELLELNATKYGLTDLAFDSLTFLNKYIIAFRIVGEGGNAYPVGFARNFVFDLESGNRLAITDLIKPGRLAAFHSLIERVVSCGFPHAAQALEDHGNIFLTRAELTPFLREYLY